VNNQPSSTSESSSFQLLTTHHEAPLMFQNESEIDVFNVTVINSNATRFAGSSSSSSNSQQMSDVTRAQQAINVQSAYAMPSVSTSSHISNVSIAPRIPLTIEERIAISEGTLTFEDVRVKQVKVPLYSVASYMSLTVPELKERIQVRKIHIPPGTTKKDQFVAILVEADRQLQLQQQQPHGNDLQVNANSTGTTTSSTHNNRPLLTALANVPVTIATNTTTQSNSSKKRARGARKDNSNNNNSGISNNSNNNNDNSSSSSSSLLINRTVINNSNNIRSSSHERSRNDTTTIASRNGGGGAGRGHCSNRNRQQSAVLASIRQAMMDIDDSSSCSDNNEAAR
jgi:hypothetical protein